MLKFKSLVSANSTTAAKIGRNKIANFSFAKFMREKVSDAVKCEKNARIKLSIFSHFANLCRIQTIDRRLCARDCVLCGNASDFKSLASASFATAASKNIFDSGVLKTKTKQAVTV